MELENYRRKTDERPEQSIIGHCSTVHDEYLVGQREQALGVLAVTQQSGAWEAVDYLEIHTERRNTRNTATEVPRSFTTGLFSMFLVRTAKLSVSSG